MTRAQFDSFVRIFGGANGSREGAILRAWRLLFDQTTGVILPYFWGTVDRDRLQRVVHARPRESLPFALRYSGREIGFAVAHGSAGPPPTADTVILLSPPDRSRLQLLGLPDFFGSIGAAVAANPGGFATPVESELAERCADALVAEPHWNVTSAPLQALLHKLAGDVQPGAGFGAAVLRGSRSAVGSAARRAEGARALELGRAALRAAPTDLVGGACRFAAAAGAAAALSDWYSFLLGLVNAAVCLTAEYRRVSGLPPVVARGAGAGGQKQQLAFAAAVLSPVAPSAPSHPLYPRAEVLASDAATLLTSVNTYAGHVPEAAERLYAQCGACDALWVLYRGRAELQEAAGGAAAGPEAAFGAHALAAARFHLGLLTQAGHAGIAVSAAEAALVAARAGEGGELGPT